MRGTLDEALAGLNNHRHVSRGPRPRWLDGNFDVLAENRQEFHQPPYRDRYGPTAHQRGNLSLGGAEELGSFRLR